MITNIVHEVLVPRSRGTLKEPFILVSGKESVSRTHWNYTKMPIYGPRPEL